MRDLVTELLPSLQAWLATAVLHTAVLGVAALTLERLLSRASAGAREWLWRAALLGGAGTATLQLGAGIDPWTGSWHALEANAPAPVPASELVIASPPIAAGSSPSRLPATEPARLADVATFAWLALATLALAHLAVAYTFLRRALAPRIPSAHLREQADAVARALRLRRTPRITTSARASTPLALGLLHPEVCVPERAVVELDLAELHAMLAHELAHLRRRDPAWSLLYGAVCRALFFHPVVWFARRRLLALAELRCDAAARSTHPQAGVALARVLVRAAQWLARAPRDLRLAHGHAMAATTSGLQQRVRCLLADPPRRSRFGSTLARASAVVLCTGAPMVLPDVRARAIVASAPALLAAPAAPLAALPASVITLARDIAALRAEVNDIEGVLAGSALASDASVLALMRAIAARLTQLETRCTRLVAQFELPASESDVR
jgi:beta-lactamase regulating signal transducer with metallopeptidase domain